LPLDVGAAAPDFTLPGTGGREYTLSAYRGQPVVLVFYPGDATPVCTRQLGAYNDELATFDRLGAQVLAISPQDVDSHERFAGAQGYAFPLLADTSKSVGQAYGIIGPLGLYRRSVFVVDAGGVIRWRHSGLTGLTYQPAGAIESALAALA
jgi:peroxiredoxin Q/BCP